jgi:hypothetical protein
MNMFARAPHFFICRTKYVELAQSHINSLVYFLVLSTFQRVGVKSSSVSSSFTGKKFRTCIHIACVLHFHPIIPSSL